MPFYLVTWQIELDADTPEGAALTAQGIQLDRASIATFYYVVDQSTGEGHLINTNEAEEEI